MSERVTVVLYADQGSYVLGASSSNLCHIVAAMLRGEAAAGRELFEWADARIRRVRAIEIRTDTRVLRFDRP